MLELAFIWYGVIGALVATYMEIRWPSKGLDFLGRFPIAVVFWPAAAVAMYKDRNG